MFIKKNRESGTFGNIKILSGCDKEAETIENGAE